MNRPEELIKKIYEEQGQNQKLCTLFGLQQKS